MAYRPIIYHIYPRPISSLPVSLPEGGREGGQGAREKGAGGGGGERWAGGGGRREGGGGRREGGRGGYRAEGTEGNFT